MEMTKCDVFGTQCREHTTQ